MNEGHIARRYAKALLEYAAARGEDTALYDRMKLLSGTVADTPHLLETISSPVVPYADKLQLLYNLSGATAAEDSYQRFVRLLLKNRRENLVRNIALGYITLYRLARRIGQALLISAEPLPEAIIERIRRRAEQQTQGKVEIENRIDPSIKGGFIFQINDLRLDASVAGQLEKVRRQFIRKNKIIV
ncbi:MAG: F0F1 ATP synthase subunit delta [Prevotellaceae bacterium]|jgi:F-type H+-transporting ATPase subunit delta|nr:F0F1 ATP synthase subunit delta [Prevotellaceae bacterium]